jgi:anti-sigma factor RsiW
VTHRRAARLLTALLDGGLPSETRRAIRAHVRECPFCRRRLRQHEGIEALVRLLPPTLLPEVPDRAAQVRLWGLARWFVDPVARARERYGISAVGVGAFALAAVLTLSVSSWTFRSDHLGELVLAQGGADVASMLPLGWR